MLYKDQTKKKNRKKWLASDGNWMWISPLSAGVLILRPWFQSAYTQLRPTKFSYIISFSLPQQMNCTCHPLASCSGKFYSDIVAASRLIMAVHLYYPPTDNGAMLCCRLQRGSPHASSDGYNLHELSSFAGLPLWRPAQRKAWKGNWLHPGPRIWTAVKVVVEKT